MPSPEQPQTTNPGTTVTPAESTQARKGPAGNLNQPSGIPILRYPLDLGQDPIYKHVLRINIYQQIKSAFKDKKTLGANAFDNEKAGASKVTKITDVFTGGLATATAAAAKTGGNLFGSLVGLDTAGDTAFKAGQAAAAVVAIQGKSLERKTEKKAAAYISLYVPETMVFTDRHDFDPVSVTEALGSIGVAGAIAGGGGLTSGELAGAAAEGSGQFGPGIKEVSMFDKGYALNPQLEILYKGSKNRQFVFSFKFTPRNQKEAEAVMSIIKTLRYHAAPEYGKEVNASRYFIPPSEFDIEFYIGSDPNKNLPRIAQCVLENVDVNYAAAGQYATFSDGMPVEITMQLTFTETIVLTKEDIDSGF